MSFVIEGEGEDIVVEVKEERGTADFAQLRGGIGNDLYQSGWTTLEHMFKQVYQEQVQQAPITYLTTSQAIADKYLELLGGDYPTDTATATHTHWRARELAETWEERREQEAADAIKENNRLRQRVAELERQLGAERRVRQRRR